MSRVAAEGGDGLRLGDFFPAAETMCFVVSVNATVLPMADSAHLARPRVAEVAVLQRLEAGPAMADRLADEDSTGQDDDIPDPWVVVVEGVVDVVEPHTHPPSKRPVFVTLAKWFSDEFPDLFAHRNSSPAVHRQAGRWKRGSAERCGIF